MPAAGFLIFSLLGSLLVVGFAPTQKMRRGPTQRRDSADVLAAVIVCARLCVEGAKLTRELGGWQVIRAGRW